MSSQAKVLCFSGSLRRDSHNKKLVKVAMAGASEAGAEVTFIDLADYMLPLYNEDDEKSTGIPEKAKELKSLLKEHNALLIASPEYNSSLSGALKNVIDWTSRPEAGEPSLACYKGKVAGLLAASPGALGGLRGLVAVRTILGNIGVIVINSQVAVSQAHEAFTEDGSLKDEKKQTAAKGVGAEVVRLTGKLNS